MNSNGFEEVHDPPGVHCSQQLESLKGELIYRPAYTFIYR